MPEYNVDIQTLIRIKVEAETPEAARMKVINALHARKYDHMLSESDPLVDDARLVK